MPNVVLDMAMSLDGFIVGANDENHRRRLFEHINPESFEPEDKDVIESPGVTHLRSRVASKGEILWLRAQTSLK